MSYQHSMEVVLELDKRGGLFTEGHDAFSRFTVDYATLLLTRRSANAQ